VIERAVRDYLAARARAVRDARDLEIMNRLTDTYNVETAGLMTYQPWIKLGRVSRGAHRLRWHRARAT
jgi:hypothetical protein